MRFTKTNSLVMSVDFLQSNASSNPHSPANSEIATPYIAPLSYSGDTHLSNNGVVGINITQLALQSGSRSYDNSPRINSAETYTSPLLQQQQSQQQIHGQQLQGQQLQPQQLQQSQQGQYYQSQQQGVQQHGK